MILCRLMDLKGEIYLYFPFLGRNPANLIQFIHKESPALIPVRALLKKPFIQTMSRLSLSIHPIRCGRSHFPLVDDPVAAVL